MHGTQFPTHSIVLVYHRIITKFRLKCKSDIQYLFNIFRLTLRNDALRLTLRYRALRSTLRDDPSSHSKTFQFQSFHVFTEKLKHLRIYLQKKRNYQLFKKNV